MDLIPQTPTAAWAREMLHDCVAPHVARHCERSFQFAALLAEADGASLDHEVLYVGTVLHDVGLGARFDGDARFEVRGANAVRSMLLEREWPRDRAEQVWDVIALHASTQLAAHKSAETNYANRGISTDLRGDVGGLRPGDVRTVLDAHPRTAFPDAFCQSLIDEVRAHPATVRLSWLEHVAVEAIPGYQPANLLAGLRSTTDFC